MELDFHRENDNLIARKRKKSYFGKENLGVCTKLLGKL